MCFFPANFVEPFLTSPHLEGAAASEFLGIATYLFSLVGNLSIFIFIYMRACEIAYSSDDRNRAIASFLSFVSPSLMLVLVRRTLSLVRDCR